MASTAVRSLASAGRAGLSGVSVASSLLSARALAPRLTSTTCASVGRPGCVAAARCLSARTASDAASASASASASERLTASRGVSDGGSSERRRRAAMGMSVGAWVVVSFAACTAVGLSSAFSDATPVQPDQPGAPGLSPKDWTPLALKAVRRYNHNSQVYTFALPDASSFLNLPVSSCVMLRYKGADGKDVVRPYTPIETHRRGEVVLLIKSYDAGNMSRHVAQLKPGDTLDFKGPMAKLKYEPNRYKRIGMLAGGSGITPMLQVLEEIANNPDDKSQTHLVFANVSSKDILLKETLDDIARQHPNIKVTYVISSAEREKDWAGEVGRINKDFIKRVVPFSARDKDVFMYVCGPPAFMKAISGDKAKDYSQGEVDGALKELGFSKEQVYKF